MDFYERYYSANQMSLAIVAPQSLSQLEKFASAAFGSIPNRNVSPPEDDWAFRIPPYGSGKAGIVPAEKSIVEIVPIQELRQVTITWPIVFSSKEERTEFRLNKVCCLVLSFPLICFLEMITNVNSLIEYSRTILYRGFSGMRASARCYRT